ncbi:non-ribosomal peptide synthetase [Ktedonobacteria bacterium brp13]|nr:non-ribosomal peptide synthetase [Ktedonobacteria bacterium brp13]
MQTTGLKGARLSPQQERLWSLQGENSAYRALCAVRLQGALELRAFQQAFQRIVEMHEILHTQFRIMPSLDVPVQVIGQYADFSVPYIDLQALEPSVQEKLLDAFYAEQQSLPFTLTHGLLVRFFLFRLSPNTHLLLLCLPALCADASALPLLIGELSRTYEACLQGQEPDELPLQYIDIVAWQKKMLAAEGSRSSYEFWERIALSQLSTLRLPLERSGQESMQASEFDPRLLPVVIDETLSSSLHALARQYGTSLSTIVLAAWLIALGYLTGNTDQLLGVACDGRLYEELTEALGLYTRFVPLSAHFEQHWSFEQVVASVDVMLQDAVRGQAYFTWSPQVENDSPNMFPITFEHERWPATINVGEVNFHLTRRWCCSEPFALKLTLLEEGERVHLELYYDPQHIVPAHVQRVASVLHQLLKGVVEALQQPVGSLQLLEQHEIEYLLTTFRAPQPLVSAQGLHQLFEAHVERTPHQLAVVSVDEQLTYLELHRLSNRLARALRRKGVGAGHLVGLCLPRSARMIVALLAVLKAGAAYVPLDPESPAARLDYQLRDSQTSLVLTREALFSRLADWQEQLVDLDALLLVAEQEADTNLPVSGHGEDPAYMIYTSGSTGLSKGVLVPQKSIVNYTQALCTLLGGAAGWQYATVSTLAADLGNTAIFCALASGGCLQVLDYATITSAEAYAHWVAQHPIDVLKIVPSHLSALLAGDADCTLLPRRALILGGEVLPFDLLEKVHALGGSCTIYNHYGPTEATIGVLTNNLGRVDDSAFLQRLREGQESIPLGSPLAGCEVYVLDDWMHVVPPELAGELYIGGQGLAHGYLHQPEQTAERFVPHPWSQEPGARLYKTGDLACYTPQGQIAFLGRRDQQVKLRGFRIEPGEIEAVLKRHPNVWDAVVVLREDRAGEKRLVGYIVPQQQPAPTNDDLRTVVREQLPEYMLPATFVYLHDLPLTPNGKLDRKRLPDPVSYQDDAQAEITPPRSPVEEILLGIWKELLAVPSIGIHDNFFHLGGHSLLATQVLARVRLSLQVELPIPCLFENPTVAGFAQRVEQALRGDQALDELPLLPVARTQPLPLSFAQQRLWFLYQLEPDSVAYLLSRSLLFCEPLNLRALQGSFTELVRRHEVLRTVFQMQGDQPVQVIKAAGNFALPLVDLQGLTPQERQAEALRFANQETQCPFDLSHDPPLRTTLLRLDAQTHVLLWTMHHIVTDAWSNSIFVRELTTLYKAFSAGKPSPLSPLPIQYADFAVWQRQWLQGAILANQQAYWERQLTGASPLELPTDRVRPPIQTYQGAYESLALPPALYEELLALSHKENVTFFMLLLAAFNVLLARYSGQTDICVGTPIANRTRIELEDLIGFFVNTLVLRTNLADNPPFVDLLRQVREVALGAYAHQDVPFEQLVELLQPERDLSRSPLFQVMFSVAQQERTSVERHALVNEEEQLLVLPFHAGHETKEIATKFDLELNIFHGEQGLFCAVIYNRDLFERSSIQRMLAHFAVLLEHIATEPAHPIASLPLLTAAERQQILVDWNQTQRPAPQPHSFVHLFTAQAAATPTRLAVMDGVTRLTYRELDQRANQLAHWLRDVGVQPEELVGIHMSRSVEFLVAVLGVFKAGGAYVPLDPAYPSAHLAFICADARIQILITQPNWRDALPITPRAICYLAPTFQALEAYSKDAVPVEAGGEQLAYVIYTSGSTGRPKGAMVTQRGMLNHLWAKVETLELTQHDIVAQTASPCFDISVWQMLSAFLVGGQVCMIPDQITHDPVGLFERIATSSLTILEVVPSLLRAYLEEIEREDRPGGQPWLTSLRWLVVTGEQLSVETGQRWQQRYPGIALLNAYGPTECSDDVTHARLTADVIDKVANVPIGRAIANTQLYLLSEGMEPVPVGVPGQIYVGGMGVGRGYLGEAERTALAFVPNPFGRQEGERLYRTGDLGRYRADGQIEFLRRIDQQVKLRGYRIELGEIEAVLRAHPAIGECVVMLREEQGDAYLTAYVVGRGAESAPARPELISYLQERLPQYMLPAAVVVLSELPLTSNGKIDRRALPVPEKRDGVEEGKSQQIMTPFEEVLQGIWCEVLKKERIDLQANFFDLGGHSLLATQLVSRIRAVLQVEVPLRLVFEEPTIAGSAQWLARTLQDPRIAHMPPLVPVPRTQGLPLSFAQQRLWLVEQLQPGSTAYLVPTVQHIHGPLDMAVLQRCFVALLQRHESLRTSFYVHEGQPVQQIATAEEVRVHLALIDLADQRPEIRDAQSLLLVEQERRVPFDPGQAPLWRVLLLRLDSEDHLLLVTMHHIITDGWSNDVFYQELMALYHAFRAGQPSPLPVLPLQYADFAVWQRRWLQGEVLEAQLTYWTRQLSGAPPLKLPLDHPRPDVPSQRGQVHHFSLTTEHSQALLALSRKEGVTLFMVLLAAFQVLLYRYSGQTDIVVGTDSANRNHLEIEKIIGFFINLLVLRTDLSGKPSFRTLLARIRKVALDAYAYQETPFDLLVEKLIPDHSLHYIPLVQALIVLQNLPPLDEQSSAESTDRVSEDEQTALPLVASDMERAAKFDLALFMFEQSGRLHGALNYRSDLFESRTIETLVARFTVLLQSIVSQPDASIDKLEFFTQAEREQQEQAERRLRNSLSIRTGGRFDLPDLNLPEQ